MTELARSSLRYMVNAKLPPRSINWSITLYDRAMRGEISWADWEDTYNKAAKAKTQAEKLQLLEALEAKYAPDQQATSRRN